jgi:hypothetical protein
MDTLAHAIAICHNAEKALRELMRGAIGAGEYRDLPTLARFAEQMSQMAAKLAQNPEPPPLAPARAAATRPAAPSRRRTRARRRGRVKQSGQPQPAVRSIKAEYPRFRRDGQTLVKTGWSKSAKAEYQHRAPKTVAGTLLKAIAALEAKMPVFTVDALLPLADPTDNTEIPGYQVYLALAWLRKEGIVRQLGREGYSLLVKSELDKSLEDRWTALPDESRR